MGSGAGSHESESRFLHSLAQGLVESLNLAVSGPPSEVPSTQETP